MYILAVLQGNFRRVLLFLGYLLDSDATSELRSSRGGRMLPCRNVHSKRVRGHNLIVIIRHTIVSLHLPPPGFSCKRGAMIAMSLCGLENALRLATPKLG